MLFLNVEGLLRGKPKQKKLDFLREIAKTEKPVFIVGIESHLNINIDDTEIAIPNYSVYRSDRLKRKQGGVVIYVRTPYLVDEKTMVKFSNDACELLILKIKEINLTIVCVYRPPDTTQTEFNECINNVENYFKDKTLHENIVILGDFNLPHLKWNLVETKVISNMESGGPITEQIAAARLLELTESLFCQQTITKPTRINNVLDLIFTNNEDLLSEIIISECDPGISDHKLITTDLNIESKEAQPQSEFETESCSKLEKFAFWSKKCRWECVTDKLSNTNWEQHISQTSDLNSDLSFIYKQCYSSCEGNIPEKRKYNENHIPHDRKVLMRKRRIQRSKLPKAKTQRKAAKIEKKIVNLEQKLLESHKQDRIRKENDAVSAILSNSKAFFKYAKQSNNKNCDIGPLVNENGDLENDPKGKSEILRKQYEKVFSTKKADIEVKIGNDNNDTGINIEDFFNNEDATFTDVTVTEDDVKRAIEETRINSAPGVDCVPPILLHKCKNQLLKPLTTIMNKSIKTGILPDIWKEAIITPIFKKGLKELPCNYRPVSLTSQIAKLLERIVRWYLVQYLELNNAFPETQHGFRASRSTVSQLLEHYDEIIDALERNSNIDIVMLDFCKAFDKINISILLKKLKLLGIGGNIAKWIANFLIKRKQKVVVNKQSSKWSEVRSGVPQGTILAALFFLVYIADIGNEVKHSSLSSYADDSKLKKIIENQSDAQKLQEDLTKVYKWTDENIMEFNTTKFEILRIGKNENLKSQTSYQTPDGKAIPESEVVKDLGVLFNKYGNFDDQLKVKIAKCNKMSGYILRTFVTREPGPMMSLFKSLVIPIMDYGSVIWNPWKRKDIQAIEQIQRNFTKRINNLSDESYYERLKHLKIYSMERRRQRYEILYIYKILKHQVPNVGLKWKFFPRRGRELVPPPVRKNSRLSAVTMRRNSFRGNAPYLFNCLPVNLRNIDLDTPMPTIKRTLDRYLNTVTDEPVLNGCRRSNDAASNSIYHQVVRRFSLDH